MLSWAIAGPGGITAASDNADTAHSTTESMVKPWIAADYLRRNPDPSGRRLAELTDMIIDSSDTAAEDVYRAGGGTAVIERMIAICGLTRTRAVPGWWSRTETTAADAARLGACLADGRAAGGGWTPWLLDRMRDVRGEGRFGAVQALPAAGLAIKNGWTLIGTDGNWHVSCLAIGPGWSLGVLVRYPAHHGLAYGSAVCADITRQLP